jgi:peptidoglycan/LPS O-acetylase OafA/YrhL
MAPLMRAAAGQIGVQTLPLRRTKLLVSSLGTRNNGLDLLRLFAACLVILGHSYAIVGTGMDPMLRWNGVEFSGGFALHVFFFLSGLLVTHSFLSNPDIVRWLASRVLRIFPALFCCLALTALVFGPFASTLPPRQYFSTHETWDYFFGNLLLRPTRYYLPGVFTHGADASVNGPLWSLYIEVRLYLGIAILLWLFRRARREWVTLAIFALVAVGMAAPNWIFVFGENNNYLICSALFLAGALCALWSEKVVISGLWLAVLFLAANKYVYTAGFTPLFFFFTCYFVLYFGYSRVLSGVRLPGDYSYGLYIYGWPMQRLIAEHFPHWPPLLNAVTAMAGAGCLAILSWHFVEKPSLAQKDRFSRAVARHSRLVVIPLAAAGIVLSGWLYFRYHPIQRLGNIVAFGPSPIVAGTRFNVHDGVSAIWVQLSSAVEPDSRIVFRGRELKSVVYGSVVSGAVPDELFKTSGEAEVYVLSDSYVISRRSSITKIVIASPSQ